MAKWQWYILGALSLFIGYHLIRSYRDDRRLDHDSIVVNATIMECVFVRSSGLILHYSFSTNGKAYDGKGACNELRSMCSEENCCTGALLEVEYWPADPSVCRIKQPPRSVP